MSATCRGVTTLIFATVSTKNTCIEDGGFYASCTCKQQYSVCVLKTIIFRGQVDLGVTTGATKERLGGPLHGCYSLLICVYFWPSLATGPVKFKRKIRFS